MVRASTGMWRHWSDLGKVALDAPDWSRMWSAVLHSLGRQIRTKMKWSDVVNLWSTGQPANRAQNQQIPLSLLSISSFSSLFSGSPNLQP